MYVLAIFLLFVYGSNKVYSDEYRLNNDVIPEYYKIDLKVSDDFQKDSSFIGEVTITIKVLNDTDIIRMNEDMIKINTNSIKIVNTNDDSQVWAPAYTANNTLQIFTLKLNSGKLSKNNSYTINIKYNGTLHDDMYGFYRSSYLDDKNETQWIATTQFQATFARRAFPCFDEPALKAKFKISIEHHEVYNVIGNTLIESSERIDNTQRNITEFKETPTMSTYLVAFIVHKFEKLFPTKGPEVDGILHTLYARSDLINTGQYATDTAPEILEVMKRFTLVSYSASTLEKLDLVAIPDFAAGAMENWGLATYRETALLWNSTESSLKNKERVGTVVAHELAHMWFGDLITCDWWSYTWLNEGFARYFEYMALHELDPDMELNLQFVVEQQQNIFVTDSVEGVQTLTSSCSTPSEISSKFGSITYNKGASIIRMIENFMGTNNFKRAIQEYFATSEHFKTSTPQKLWNALSNVPGINLDVATIMKNWTESEGFPLVHVDLKNGILSFYQHRFLYDGTSNSTIKYHIPISLWYKGEESVSTSPKLWLTPTVDNTTYDELPSSISNQWVIVNVDETAYYRVKYSDQMYDQIENALKSKNFSEIRVLNRAQIVDDVLNLARAGYVNYTRALDMVNYISTETEYYPWSSALNAFAFLKKRIDSQDELSPLLDQHFLSLMSNMIKNVSFENGTLGHIPTLKRTLILNWACSLGHEGCVKEAQSTFAKLKENNLSVDPNARSVVYCTALRHSKNNDNWDYLWDKFRKTQLATESVTILSALGCSINETILKEYLNKSIDPTSGIRRQDAQSVFTAVISGNPEGVSVGLQFLIDDFKGISEYYGSLNALSGVITSLADRLTTKEQVDKLKKFVEEKEEELKDAAEVAKTAITTAENNLKWADSKRSELLNYFKTLSSSTTASSTTASSTTASSTTASSSTASSSSTSPTSTSPSSTTSSSISPSSTSPLLILLFLLSRGNC